MNCEYFGKCGSCTIHDVGYEGQLDYKIQRENTTKRTTDPKKTSNHRILY